MAVYSNIDGKLKKLNLLPIDKEKALQKLVEENLLEVLEMRFLSTEYPTTHGGRIDTLAIDSDGAPVIIEYKRNRNDNVINQALSYLKWLKVQKVEFFEMLYIKKFGADGLPKIDWNNPRVICIAESYSKYDIDTLEVIPLRLELYKFRYYENNLFALDKINGEEEKVEIISKEALIKGEDKTTSDVEKIEYKKENVTQLFELNLKEQLSKASPFIKELFFSLESKIFELDDRIYKKVNINNIGFRVSKMFAEAHIQKDSILVYLRTLEYNDPLGKVLKVPDTHGWVLNRGIRIYNSSDLEYAINLIERSYQDIL